MPRTKTCAAAALVGITILAAGCSSGPSAADLSQANDRVSELEADLSQSRDEQADLEKQVTALQADKAALESDLAAAQDAAAEAQTLAGQLQDERDLLVLRYDPQIQQALDSLQIDAVAAACDLGKSDAADDYADDDPIGRLGLQPPAGLPVSDIEELVDADKVSSEYERCRVERRDAIKEEKRKAQAAKEQARLTKDKGSGFYTVGEEIAAGTWRSTGSGEYCYWERLSGFSGEFDQIIANYFGVAGVTVTISPSDAAFKTQDCGIWEYVG